MVSAAVAITALLTACGGVQSRFASHLRRGRAYYAQGDLAKAGVEFRNAMQIEPKSAAARFEAGRAAEGLGRLHDAAALYQSAIDLDPAGRDARAALVRLFLKAGAGDLARKTLEAGLAAHPDDATLLTLRAAARSELKDRAGAIADADQALRLAPTDEETIEVRAGLYRQSGDLPAAISLVSGAVQRAPSSEPLREVLADLYDRNRQQAKAEEQLKALVSLAPSKLQYRMQLAVFYSRTHRPDDAQRVLEAAVKAFPKSNDAKLALVDFLSTERTRAQGEAILRGFIAEQPDDEDLRLALGALLRRAGATKDAIAVYTDVVQRAGTSPPGLTARDRLASIAVSQGRQDDARRLVGEVLSASPSDSDALTVRAEMSLARANALPAVTDLRTVLRDHPEAIPVRQLLARAYVMNQQPSLAVETLQSAVDLAPGDARLRVQLAQLLLESRDPEQAVAQLDEAARRAPADAVVQTEIARTDLAARRFGAARAAAETVEKLRPDASTGPYLLGMADIGLDHSDLAQKELERALAIEPRAFDALEALARLEEGRGHTPQAIEIVKSAVAKDPANGAALDLLGKLYLSEKDRTNAEAALVRATQAAPKWWVAYRDLALARIAAGDDAGGIEAYKSGIAAAPSEPQLALELAALYEGRKRADDAIALCGDWHRRNPGVRAVTRALAMLLVTYRTDRESLDRARDLTADFATSSDGDLLDAYGWVRFRRAEYEQALPVLQRALQQAPDSREILYHLAMTELRMGQTDRARSDLQAALSGAAKFFGADEARSTLATLGRRSG